MRPHAASDTSITSALATCRAITRERASTFWFASHLLPRGLRDACCAVYAFCRRADDAVDEASSPPEARSRLADAAAILERAYSPAGPIDSDPVVRALAWAGREHGVTKEPLLELLEGMALDLEPLALRTTGELLRYCRLAAGTVGRALAPALGADQSAQNAAESLGLAMQLTNIRRDIDEDLGRGRIYLPAQELAEHGLDHDALRARRTDEPLRAFLRRQIARARRVYAQAEPGIARIAGWRARLCVRAMGVLYGEILGELERRGLDPFAGRVRVSMPRKLWLLVTCLFGRPLSRENLACALPAHDSPASTGSPRMAGAPAFSRMAGSGRWKRKPWSAPAVSTSRPPRR